MSLAHAVVVSEECNHDMNKSWNALEMNHLCHRTGDKLTNNDYICQNKQTNIMPVIALFLFITTLLCGNNGYGFELSLSLCLSHTHTLSLCFSLIHLPSNSNIYLLFMQLLVVETWQTPWKWRPPAKPDRCSVQGKNVLHLETDQRLVLLNSHGHLNLIQEDVWSSYCSR